MSELSNKSIWDKMRESEVSCSEIIENKLYLGSDDFASDLSQLQETGITHILQVHDSFKPKFEGNGLIYKKIYAIDDEDFELYDHFDEAADWIKQVLDESPNHKIFVHCRNGHSRSATLVVAYLMKHLMLHVEEAFTLVKNKRSVINPNRSFLEQLEDYETELEEREKKLHNQ
ncbi:hypothetical protein ABK040_007512 [Willaertia magna]